MSESPSVLRGQAALRRLLRERTTDLRTVEMPEFRLWLQRQLSRWERDPVFAQQSAIRDLRRAHPRLSELEAARRAAVEADQSSPASARLGELERELIGAEKAVEGLSGALTDAPEEKRSGLRAKLERFRSRCVQLRAERDALTRSSPERQARLEIESELDALRARIGLARAEAELRGLLREQGRRSGRSGRSFESTALELAPDHVLSELSASASDVLVLRGVTLGAARTELDQVVVGRPSTSGSPAEVLAVVEVKRSLNDLGHGFRRRQENLAWLTGDARGYDPAEYRTRHFRTGHFDRAATHPHGDATVVLTPESFHRFRRDAETGFFLDRLFFVSRPGWLWGLSSAALARIRSRVATDPLWDPDDPAYLHGLLGWCRSLGESVEAPDVLRLFCASERRARQIVLLRDRRD